MRHSKQIDGDADLPQFGVQTSSRDEEEGEENMSFQTVREDDDLAPSMGETEPATIFYGPEKPQYDEMVSIIQGETNLGELIDESALNQISRLD